MVLIPSGGHVAVGDSAGVYVDSLPQWEFELDVCGRVRRYAFDSRNERFFEKKVTCEKGICLDAQPPCRNATRGTWWAVERSELPDRCSDALVDDNLSPTMDGNRVEVTISNPGPSARVWWIGGACKEPSLMASVDGHFFSLCGDVPMRRASLEAGGSMKVPAGPFLAAGPHEIEIFHTEPLESAWPPCRRSGVRKIDVPATAP